MLPVKLGGGGGGGGGGRRGRLMLTEGRVVKMTKNLRLISL